MSRSELMRQRRHAKLKARKEEEEEEEAARIKRIKRKRELVTAKEAEARRVRAVHQEEDKITRKIKSKKRRPGKNGVVKDEDEPAKVRAVKVEQPPAYRSLSQNLYRKPLVRSTVPLGDVPTCDCRPAGETLEGPDGAVKGEAGEGMVSEGCGPDCAMRAVYMECAPGCCPSLAPGEVYCCNSSIQTRSFPRTEVFKTGDKGWAMRLLEDVEADTILVEYLGEVITETECLDRMASYAHGDDFYFMALDAGLVLDARPMGSTARFANHHCEPNSRLQKWVVQGEPRLALVSQEPIRAGDEITYNYHYFEDGLDCPRQKCLCGARNCSKLVGGRVEVRESDRWCARVRSALDREPLAPPVLQTALAELVKEVETSPDETGLRADVEGGEDFAQAVALLEEAREWDQWLRTRLVSGMGLDAEEVAALLTSAPARVRTAGSIDLRARVGQAQRLEKALAFYAPSLGGVAGSGAMDWRDMVRFVRDADAVAPLLTGPLMAQLMQLYGTVTAWALRHIAPHCSELPSWSHNRRHMSSSLWPTIHKVGKLYGVPVSPLPLAVCDLLEDRSEAFLLRSQLRALSMNDPSEKDLSRALAAAVMHRDGVGRGAVGAAPPAPPINPEDMNPKKLHCYCWLPELESEPGLGVMLCCDVCARWCHPQCINMTPTAANTSKSRTGFACPLCLHARNAVCGYARAPSLEWQIPRVKSSAEIDRKTKTFDALAREVWGERLAARAAQAAGTGVEVRQTTPIAPAAAADTDVPPVPQAGQPTVSASSSSSSSASPPAKLLLSSSPPPGMPLAAATGLLPRTYTRSGFKSRELLAALEAARGLRVANVPAVRMLHLLLSFHKDWAARVSEALVLASTAPSAGGAAPLASPSPPGGTLALPRLTPPAPSPRDPAVEPFAYCVDAFGEARMDQELSALQQWLWLYLEMRVVMVCPDLVAELRRAIWLLQARALVRTLARAFSSCAAAVPELAVTDQPATAPPVRATLAELADAIAGGEACGASGRVEVAALRWALAEARAAMSAAGAFLSQQGLAQDAAHRLEEAVTHSEKVNHTAIPENTRARHETMRPQEPLTRP